MEKVGKLGLGKENGKLGKLGLGKENGKSKKTRIAGQPANVLLEKYMYKQFV